MCVFVFKYGVCGGQVDVIGLGVAGYRGMKKEGWFGKIFDRKNMVI